MIWFIAPFKENKGLSALAVVSGCHWIRAVDPGLYLLEEEGGVEGGPGIEEKGKSWLVGKCLKTPGAAMDREGMGDFRPEASWVHPIMVSRVWCWMKQTRLRESSQKRLFQLHSL